MDTLNFNRIFTGNKNVIFNKKTKIMKKIVFALFVAITLVACGSGASTEVKTDSTTVSTDTTLVAADSTVKADSVTVK